MQERSIKIIEQAPVGLITFDVNGEIDYINQNFKKFGALYRFETPDIKGGSVFQAEIFPYNFIIDELKEVLTGIPFEKQIKQVVTKDGRYIDLIIKGAPIYEKENITGGILIIEDIKLLFGTKAELEQRSDYFEEAIHHVNDAIIITGSDGLIKFVSGTALERLGLSKSDSEKKNILELRGDETKDIIARNIEKVTSSNLSSRFEFRLPFKDQILSYSCKLEPILSKRGTLKFLFFFINDVTEVVSERNALKKQIKEFSFYKSINDNLNNALFVLDNDGSIIYWNKKCEEAFNLTSDEVKGKFFGSVLELFDKKFFDNIKQDLATEKIWKVNLNIFGKGHKKEIFEARFSFFDDYQNTIVVLCSNITRKAQEEEEKSKRENSFKSLLDHSSELICKITSQGLFTYANKNFLHTFGLTDTGLGNIEFESLLDKNSIETSVFDVNKLDKATASYLELHFTDAKDTVFFATVKFVPQVYESQLLHFLCYINIIPAKKTEDKTLLYPGLFEASQDGIAVESDGCIVIANDSFANIFGYKSGQELQGKDILDFVSNDDILKVAEYFRLKEQGKSAPDRFEFLGRKKDNSYFYTELSISSFTENDKSYVAIVTRDITERKRAQKVIRESEEKYRNITDNIDDFLYSFERIDRFMRPVFYTSAVEKITGFDQAEFLGDSRLFFKIIHPDDFQEVKKKLAAIMIRKTHASGELEFRIINKNGNIVWVRNKVNFIKNGTGIIQKVYGLVSDITINKRAEEELKKSTESLIKLNETKDRFISIISHDLRTPFSSILGFTDLLATDDELTVEEQKQYVKYIQESSRSMLSLVNSLLDWTRLQTGRIKFEPERFDPRIVIDKSIHTIAGTAMSKGVEIYSAVTAGKFIYADKSLINQVFNNLLSNATKFTSSGDRITISCRQLHDTNLLEFSVTDTGMGIKEENLEKLFNVDTKFTTEGSAGEKGSGLGLSLVQEIINKHGGKVWAESVFGKGSVFKFTLPIASTNILIVDDNKTDALLYSKILKNITPDYKVELAYNGIEALEKIKVSSPALVITDHAMPEMDGYNLVKELIRLGLFGKPPVIILSTEMDRNIIQDYNDLGIEYVFQKPVNLRSFKQAVEKSLRNIITTNH